MEKLEKSINFLSSFFVDLVPPCPQSMKTESGGLSKHTKHVFADDLSMRLDDKIEL